MNKPKYIRKLEKDGDIFSVLNVLFLPVGFEKFIDGLKTTIVYSDSSIGYEDVLFKYEKKIYRTTHGFYIYLLSNNGDTNEMSIYYKQEQLNELTIFVRGLLKQFKNTTTNFKGN
jgi:hypothetical protein